MTLVGTIWTGTAPGAGNPTPSGTIATTLSTDLSDHIKAVKINMSRVDVDFTNFGSGGFVEKKPGLADADISIDFFNDFAASTVDAIFGAAQLANTLYYLDIKATNSARSTTNPSYVFAVYVSSYPPLGATVGDAAEATVGFMLAGKYARLTS